MRILLSLIMLLALGISNVQSQTSEEENVLTEQDLLVLSKIDDAKQNVVLDVLQEKQITPYLLMDNKEFKDTVINFKNAGTPFLASFDDDFKNLNIADLNARKAFVKKYIVGLDGLNLENTDVDTKAILGLSKEEILTGKEID